MIPLFSLFWFAACTPEDKDDVADESSKDTVTATDTDNTADPSMNLAEASYWLDSSDGFTPVDGTTVRLQFHESSEAGVRFTLSADCNNIVGYLKIDNDTAIVSLDGVTEIGCEPSLDEQDMWLMGFMGSNPGLELSDSYLTLSNAEVTLVFIDQEIVTPDLDLTSTIWTVESFIEDDMVSTVNLEEYPTLTFADDGSLEIDTICNSCSALYTVDDELLNITELGCTLAACNDQLQSQAENHVVAVVSDGAVFYSITGSRLTLRNETWGVSCLGEQ